MKCGGFEEERSLLKPVSREETSQVRVSFPMLYMFTAGGVYGVTLVFQSFMTRNVPEVAGMSSLHSFLFQVLSTQSCMLLACYFGFMTLVTCLPLTYQRLPQYSLWLQGVKWTAQSSGFLSLLILMLISLSPSEVKTAPNTHFFTHQNILISLYFGAATLHSHSSTYLRERIHTYEVVTQASPWRSLRTFLVRLLVIGVTVYYVSICVKSLHSTWFRKCVGHMLFLCSFMFIGCYHEDLRRTEVNQRYLSRATL